MNQNKKVSIIIPVYNAEKTIIKCINSIINQTYKNIEIIIVDDGSSDNTKKILKAYSNIENLILVFKSNEGVSISRNVGLKKSTGDYILFLDADDWLENNTIEKLVDCKEKHNVDLVRYSYYLNNDETKYIEKRINIKDNKKNCKLDINNDIINYYMEGKLEGYVWLLMIDKSVIIDFDSSLSMMEDFIFILELLKKAKTICFFDECLYHYYCNQNGASNSTYNIEKKINDIILVTLKAKSILSYDNIKMEKFNLNQINLIYIFFVRMVKNKKIKEIDIRKINYENLIKVVENSDINKLGIRRKIGLFFIIKKNYKLFKIYNFLLEKI